MSFLLSLSSAVRIKVKPLLGGTLHRATRAKDRVSDIAAAHTTSVLTLLVLVCSPPQKLLQTQSVLKALVLKKERKIYSVSAPRGSQGQETTVHSDGKMFDLEPRCHKD